MKKPAPVDVRSRKAMIQREERLAFKIRAFWNARNYEVTTRIEDAGFSNKGGQALVMVRSDMINGLPVARVK